MSCHFNQGTYTALPIELYSANVVTQMIAAGLNDLSGLGPHAGVVSMRLTQHDYMYNMQEGSLSSLVYEVMAEFFPSLIERTHSMIPTWIYALPHLSPF
jgi:hypothetical protein